VGRERRACSALRGTPGYTGSGVGVAILDSGIATHTALDTRVVGARQPGVGRARSSPAIRSATARTRGHRRRQPHARPYVTPAFAGGSAPSVRLDRRARPRLARLGPHE
jgi:hypothetical protein